MASDCCDNGEAACCDDGYCMSGDVCNMINTREPVCSWFGFACGTASDCCDVGNGACCWDGHCEDSSVCKPGETEGNDDDWIEQ